METPDSQKPVEIDTTASRDQIDAGIDSTSNPPKGDSNLFIDHLTNFFRKEIPVRFGLGKWDSIALLVVAGVVLAWVVVFGYFRTHQGILGRPLKVGIVTWPGYAGGLVANNGLVRNTDTEFWQNDNSFWQNDDNSLLVDFKVIDDYDELIRQFKLGGENGGIDVMWSTVDSLAYQIPLLEKEKIRLRAFLQVDWSRGGDAIVTRKDIRRIADLKGLKVARAMSASQWLLEHSLENEDDLTSEEKLAIIRGSDPQGKGSPKAREDFENGLANAVVLWEPDVSDLTEDKPGKKADAHVLVDTSEKLASNLIADVMVAREEFLQDKNRGRPAIKAFIKGWLKGAEEANNNPMRAVQFLKQEQGFASREDDDVRRILRKVSLSTLADNVRMFGLRGGHSTFDELFNEASTLWLKRGIIQNKVAAADACDTGILEEILNTTPPDVMASVGCQGVITRKLRVDFLGKLNLSDEIRNQLDTQLGDLFRRYPEATFCVQASAGTGKDPRLSLNTAAARANAVIDYLAKRYDRRPSEFISDTTFADLVTDERALGHIRVTVMNR